MKTIFNKLYFLSLLGVVLSGSFFLLQCSAAPSGGGGTDDDDGFSVADPIDPFGTRFLVQRYAPGAAECNQTSLSGSDFSAQGCLKITARVVNKTTTSSGSFVCDETLNGTKGDDMHNNEGIRMPNLMFLGKVAGSPNTNYAGGSLRDDYVGESSMMHSFDGTDRPGQSQPDIDVIQECHNVDEGIEISMVYPYSLTGGSGLDVTTVKDGLSTDFQVVRVGLTLVDNTNADGVGNGTFASYTGTISNDTGVPAVLTGNFKMTGWRFQDAEAGELVNQLMESNDNPQFSFGGGTISSGRTHSVLTSTLDGATIVYDGITPTP